MLATKRTERRKGQIEGCYVLHWGSDTVSGHPGAQQPPLGRVSPPQLCGVHLDTPG